MDKRIETLIAHEPTGDCPGCLVGTAYPETDLIEFVCNECGEKAGYLKLSSVQQPQDAEPKELKPKVPAEKRDEFEALARPLIKWLCDNMHPHVTVIVTPTSVELLEGLIASPIDDYVLD